MSTARNQSHVVSSGSHSRTEIAPTAPAAMTAIRIFRPPIRLTRAVISLTPCMACR
jgi:hypothetical protein